MFTFDFWEPIGVVFALGAFDVPSFRPLSIPKASRLRVCISSCANRPIPKDFADEFLTDDCEGPAIEGVRGGEALGRFVFGKGTTGLEVDGKSYGWSSSSVSEISIASKTDMCACFLESSLNFDDELSLAKKSLINCFALFIPSSFSSILSRIACLRPSSFSADFQGLSS